MKLRTMFIGITMVGALAALSGCDKKADDKAAPPGSGASAPASGGKTAPAASSAAAPATDTGPKGLAAKDNDAKIVTLAKAVLGCSWEDSGFKSDCKEYKAWSDATDDFKEGAGDKTLVNMLEDPEEKVRWLAATKLWSWGSTYKTDKDLAGRVVAAAEKEKATKLAYYLGRVVGAINFEKSGTWDRVAAMIHKHDLAELRRNIVSSMLSNNKDNDAAVKLAMEMVKDSDKDMKNASIAAFSSYSGKMKADGCKFLLENADNADDGVASRAASSLASNGYNAACNDNYDALLDSLDKRVKAKNTNENSTWAWALSYMCGNDKSTDAQKARAETIAKTLATPDTKGSSLRYAALDAILKCDAKGGKAEVGKYANDKEDYVRRHAKDLLNPEKK